MNFGGGSEGLFFEGFVAEVVRVLCETDLLGLVLLGLFKVLLGLLAFLLDLLLPIHDVALHRLSFRNLRSVLAFTYRP